jgi:hypothetical protein
MGYFWSGCACAYKRGLEILGIALVDANFGDATFLKAVQTFTEKRHGTKPHCTKGMKDSDSLSSTIVADAHFSKRSFYDGITKMGFHLISRLRDDAILKYLTTVPLTGKRGEPQLFDGRVDIDNLNNNAFSIIKNILLH